MVDNNIDELDTLPPKLSYISLTSEDQTNVASKIAIMNIDPLKSTSPDNQLTITNNTIPIFSIRKLYKNLIVLSISFVLLFTAYSGISTLQSSLNTKNNVGVNSLIITYAFLIFSSIAFIGICMDLFGLKFTMIIATIGYIFYTAANIKPLPVLMYISAALVGLAAAPLWTASATYLNQIARYHSQHKNQTHDISVSLFFGIFFALFGTTTIWGNLISYFVLHQSSVAQKINCGIYFNPTSASPTNTTQNVDDTTRYILCGIFIGMGLLSMLLLFLTLDSIALTQKQTMKQLLKKSLEVLLSLKKWKHIDQFFLIPITMWTTIETAFLTAQFTRGFITCLVGIRYVGLVMVCHGIFQALSSYIFGRLVKYTGRIFVFIVAALVNYAMIILMFLWEPKASQMVLLFVIAGFWGIADAIWQTQVIATYTVFYSETDPSALAKYRLWKSVGFVISFSYASYVTIRTSLILLLIYLSISMLCYAFVEIYRRWKEHSKKKCAIANAT
ncbi:unnamed protein product [Adineta steineri]|uniref:UNC93-like protein n=1 Tax=Adineta steineri TaxID=433720 RepID=A0A814WIQ1_9BILA|nr:unnamed protein product [Adineta steineri]CAF3664878.1 unnamed protein product [Adineta steineri]